MRNGAVWLDEIGATGTLPEPGWAPVAGVYGTTGEPRGGQGPGSGLGAARPPEAANAREAAAGAS